MSMLRDLGPQPTDRIAPTTGLNAEEAAALIRVLENAHMIRLDWDPVVPGRRRARLTAEGRLIADAIAEQEEAEVAPTWDALEDARAA